MFFSAFCIGQYYHQQRITAVINVEELGIVKQMHAASEMNMDK